MSVTKAKKQFLFDIILNTASFAMYVIAQQIILMPFMGKNLNEADFAKFIIFVSVFSIISNSLGGELGVVRQIFNHKKEKDQYNLILSYLLAITFVGSLSVTLLIGYGVVDSVLMATIILLANIRLYASAFFRMHKKFNLVIIQILLLVLGIFLGIWVFSFTKFIWAPFMFGELFSFAFSLIKTDLLSPIKNVTNLDRKILKSFKDYSIVEFLVNLMTYFDKILIYPILGVLSVNTYYATTAMSKIVALITNPLHGVLLSWINSDNKEQNGHIVSKLLKYCLPVTIVVILASLPLTYLAVAVLYKQYLSDAISIMIPVSIGVGLAFVTTLIKAILLKLIDSNSLLKIHIVYIIIFVLTSIGFSHLFGLVGFAISGVVSKLYLLIAFCRLLIKIKKGRTQDD